MDLKRVKTRDPDYSFWPGTRKIVGFCPLPQSFLDQVARRVEQIYSTFEAPRADFYRGVTQAAEVLAVACVDTDGRRFMEPRDVLESADLDQISAALAFWSSVQVTANPPEGRLEAEISLLMIEGDNAILSDAARALLSDTPRDFYGADHDSLTDGQLAYYVHLCAVYRKFFDTEGRGRTRCISVSYLEKAAGRKLRRSGRRSMTTSRQAVA